MENVYLVTGEDACAIHEKAEELIHKLTDGNADAFSLEIYKESEELNSTQVIKEILISLSTPPFFGSTKTIWYQNLPFSANESNLRSANDEHPFTRSLKRLANIINTSFTSEITLVISGLGVNPKSPLYEACSKVGKVFSLAKPDLNSRSWRNDVRRIIQEKATKLKMKLSNDVFEYLLEVIGVDTSRINSEIEKIYCCAGQTPSLKQVQDLCTGNREAVFYALSNALGARDVNLALKTIVQMIGHSKEPDSLVIGQIRYLGRYVSELIQTKILMSYYKAKTGDHLSSAVARMGEEDKKRFKNNVILSKNNWRIRTLGSHAEKYSGLELIRSILLLGEADKMVVSSNLPRRFILEMLVLRIIIGKRWNQIE